MKTLRPVVGLLCIALVLFLTGCATHIKSDVVQNPPPAEKFSGFSAFEIKPVALPAENAGQAGPEKVRQKIQANVDLNLSRVVPVWQQKGAAVAPARTLVVEPSIAEFKFVSGGKRFWVGAFAACCAPASTRKRPAKQSPLPSSMPAPRPWVARGPLAPPTISCSRASPPA